MQSRSSPPPPFRHPAKPHVAGPAPGGPRPAEHNEFADALSRMFEHRQRLAPEFAPTLRDDVPLRDDTPLRDDAEDWDGPRASLLGSLIGASALRRALSIVPLAVIGYAIAWLLYFEPSQDVTARPVAELKPEAIQTAAPSEPPPPPRPQVAESKPAPQPVAASPVAPASPPAAAAAPAPPQPLSKDEIKELQGKLGAAGFAAGPIDGVVGPQTQAALRRYGQSRNLAKPEATQETLLRLRSESRASQ
jgi:type IV secretory pathway VirB10-like protein